MGIDISKSIVFSPHALQKMVDRGTTETEVEATIHEGSPEPARKERVMFRKNFAFNSQWRGKHFGLFRKSCGFLEGRERFSRESPPRKEGVG